MRLSYALLALANLLAGAFLVIVTFAFTAPVAVWIGFAVSIGLVLFGLMMAWMSLSRAHAAARLGQAAIGALTAGVAGWTIIATQVFPTGPARWLVFASGVAHVALSVLSLVMHEVTTERVVHTLEVGAAQQSREPVATA